MKERQTITNAVSKSITILGAGIVMVAIVLIAAAQQQSLKTPKLPVNKPIPGPTPGPKGNVRPGHLVLPDEAIPQKYNELGGAKGVLGKPLTGLTRCPDRVGYFIHYEHGSIYWNGDTHEVHGAVYDKWASLGWEASVLGYPITDEVVAPDRVGRINHFQNGSIYWTPTTNAHEVHGAIREAWKSLNWEHSFLGYPISDESTAPDGVGRYNHFQGGSIYWTPNTGAHEVHGPILAKWKSMGWEQSYLGYPVSNVDSNNVSQFQRGTIQMSSSGVAVDIPATKTFHVGVSFNDSTPVGGTVDLVVDAKGNYKWHGYLQTTAAFRITISRWPRCWSLSPRWLFRTGGRGLFTAPPALAEIVTLTMTCPVPIRGLPTTGTRLIKQDCCIGKSRRRTRSARESRAGSSRS